MRTRLLSIAFMLALLTTPTGAAAQTQPQPDPATMLRQEIDLQNRHDLAGVLELLTEDYVQEGGTCMELPGGRCVGKAQYAEQAAHDVGHITSTLTILDTRVVGNTSTARAEIRFTPNLPPLQAAGIDRLVDIGQAQLREGKIASLRVVPEVSDPQTARALSVPGAPNVPRAADGQSLATQSASSRAAFVAVYGIDSLTRWVQEHDSVIVRAGH